MIKYETELQEVIDTLEHIIARIESGYDCGDLADTKT